jgi:hypothetical protein
MSFAELLFFVVLGPRLWWRLGGHCCTCISWCRSEPSSRRSCRTHHPVRRARTAVAAHPRLRHRLHDRDSKEVLIAGVRRPALPNRVGRIRLPLRDGRMPVRHCNARCSSACRSSCRSSPTVFAHSG